MAQQGSQLWPAIESWKTPAYWHDGKNTHRCEGAKVLPDIFLMWTTCGRDVPAGQAHVITDGYFYGTDTVTCLKCEAGQ